LPSYSANWYKPWPAYRDIFLFSREKKIRLIGLNVPAEIPANVKKQGYASLSQEEIRQLPPGISCNVDETYVEYIKRFYRVRPSGKEFINFCEAQIIRDNAMALYTLKYLERYPNSTVIILSEWNHALEKGDTQTGRKTSQWLHDFCHPTGIYKVPEEHNDPGGCGFLDYPIGLLTTHPLCFFRARELFFLIDIFDPLQKTVFPYIKRKSFMTKCRARAKLNDDHCLFWKVIIDSLADPDLAYYRKKCFYDWVVFVKSIHAFHTLSSNLSQVASRFFASVNRLPRPSSPCSKTSSSSTVFTVYTLSVTLSLNLSPSLTPTLRPFSENVAVHVTPCKYCSSLTWVALRSRLWVVDIFTPFLNLLTACITHFQKLDPIVHESKTFILSSI